MLVTLILPMIPITAITLISPSRSRSYGSDKIKRFDRLIIADDVAEVEIYEPRELRVVGEGSRRPVVIESENSRTDRYCSQFPYLRHSKLQG